MSFSIVPIINSVPKIDSLSYLELGVWKGENHKKILCKDKASVDVEWNPTFKMTTDKFFEINERRWDIVFIDADHRLKGGLRDYNNATKVCDKFIIMHDLYPDNDMQATETGSYAGDVFKLLYHIASKKHDIEYYVLDGDCGMTVFFPPFKTFVLNEIDKGAAYQDLVNLELARFNIPQMQQILKYRTKR